MKFMFPPELKPYTKISSEFPKDYERYRIPGTEAEFISGPFGCYFTQEIRQKDWVIGFLNFDIRERVYLYPVTDAPFIGLYCGLKGNIPCELHGSEEMLVLPEDSFGFYYVPQAVMNKADFKGNYHYTGLYISFTSEFLQTFSANNPRFTSLIDKQVKRVMEGEQVDVIRLSAEAKSIIRQMKSRQQDDPHFLIFQDVKVKDMLLLYFALLRTVQRVPPAVQQALNFIADYYDTPITVAELAKEVGLTVEELKKQFKAVTGLVVDRYLKKFRTEKAEELLQNTNLKIQEIVAQTGFTDSAHLHRTFMQKHNMTPSAFRERSR